MSVASSGNLSYRPAVCIFTLTLVVAAGRSLFEKEENLIMNYKNIVDIYFSLTYYTYFCQEGSTGPTSLLEAELQESSSCDEGLGLAVHLLVVDSDVPGSSAEMSSAELTRMGSGGILLMKNPLSRSSFTIAERHSAWGSNSQMWLYSQFLVKVHFLVDSLAFSSSTALSSGVHFFIQTLARCTDNLSCGFLQRRQYRYLRSMGFLVSSLILKLSSGFKLFFTAG